MSDPKQSRQSRGLQFHTPDFAAKQFAGLVPFGRRFDYEDDCGRIVIVHHSADFEQIYTARWATGSKADVPVEFLSPICVEEILTRAWEEFRDECKQDHFIDNDIKAKKEGA